MGEVGGGVGAGECGGVYGRTVLGGGFDSMACIGAGGGGVGAGECGGLRHFHGFYLVKEKLNLLSLVV